MTLWQHFGQFRILNRDMYTICPTSLPYVHIPITTMRLTTSAVFSLLTVLCLALAALLDPCGEPLFRKRMVCCRCRLSPWTSLAQDFSWRGLSDIEKKDYIIAVKCLQFQPARNRCGVMCNFRPQIQSSTAFALNLTDLERSQSETGVGNTINVTPPGFLLRVAMGADGTMF
jgi:hypothetical protein